MKRFASMILEEKKFSKFMHMDKVIWVELHTWEKYNAVYGTAYGSYQGVEWDIGVTPFQFTFNEKTNLYKLTATDQDLILDMYEPKMTSHDDYKVGDYILQISSNNTYFIFHIKTKDDKNIITADSCFAQQYGTSWTSTDYIGLVQDEDKNNYPDGNIILEDNHFYYYAMVD